MDSLCGLSKTWAPLIFHPFWAFPEAQKINQFHHFFKNLAIMGGLLVIIGLGSGPKSLGPESDSKP